MAMERRGRNRINWFVVEIELPSWELLGGGSMDCPYRDRFASSAG